MLRHVFPVLLGVLIGAACSTPTTPASSTHFSPIPPPQAIYSINGSVIEEGTTAGIEGATVFILVDGGPDRKAVATTDAAGHYSATVLSQAHATFAARAPNTPGYAPCDPEASCFFEQHKDVDLTISNTVSFELHHPVCEYAECF